MFGYGLLISFVGIEIQSEWRPPMNHIKNFLIGATIVFALIAGFIALCHEMKKFAIRLYAWKEAYAAPVFNAGLIILLATHLFIFYICVISGESDALGGIIWLFAWPVLLAIDAIAFATLIAIRKTHHRAASVVFVLLFGAAFLWTIGNLTSSHVRDASASVCNKIYFAMYGKMPWKHDLKR